MAELQFTDETLSALAPAEHISVEQARAIGRAIRVINEMQEDVEIVVLPQPEPANRWRGYLMSHVVAGLEEL